MPGRTRKKDQTVDRAPRRSSRDGANTLERNAVALVVLALLAVLLITSFFTGDGLILRWLIAAVSGLIGRGGYLALPFALLAICARLIVPVTRGRKPAVEIQLLAILLLPFEAGLVAHTFAPHAGDMALSYFPGFLNGAQSGTAEGLLTGLTGEAMERLITLVPTRIFAIVFLLITLLYACGVTLGRALEWCIRKGREAVASLRETLQAQRLRREEEEAVAAAEAEEAEHAAKHTEKSAPRAGDVSAPAPESPQCAERPAVANYGAEYVNPARAERSDPRKGIAPIPTETEQGEQLELAPVEELPASEKVIEVLRRDNPAAKPDTEEKATRQEIGREIENIVQEIDGAAKEKPQPDYVHPPVDLLGTDHVNLGLGSEAETREGARKLTETLKSFGVEANIINVTHGPTITRYEMQLIAGIRLSKVQNLSGDIAIAMGASAVRIVLIPDRSAVGIEVPNRETSAVFLRDVLDTREFSEHKSHVAVCLGMDITGKPIVWDVGKLPHLLVAGTTGSGKSVCINSLLISLLYKSSPEEVRLIMVDPKMVELGVYNGIPHLLIPVVTDPKKAAGALQWAVLEMMSRYKRFAETGVRSLAEYNAMLRRRREEAAAAAEAAAQEREAEEDAEAPEQPPIPDPVPETVIVIDELADLMLVARNEVEEAICRIAQMGRAAGMHLIVATQRPSADVITGLMKANIPSRIAFSVASQLESRIILDTTGAEQLIGRGDMLFNPIGATKPIRIQGCFVSSEQVESVTDFIRANYGGKTSYDEDVMREVERAAEGKDAERENGESGEGSGEEDELLYQAVDLVVNSQIASTSMLQRKLGVGHARAGRIIDQMEERGIVGPFAGSKTRDVLITKEEWQEIRMRNDSINDELNL